MLSKIAKNDAVNPRKANSAKIILRTSENPAPNTFSKLISHERPGFRGVQWKRAPQDLPVYQARP